MPHHSSKKNLGSLIAVYQAQALHWRDLLTTFLPLGALTLAPLGYGVWRSYYGYTNFGVVAAEHWGRPWYFLSAVMALPLLFYSLSRLRRAHLWVTVHAHGIRVHRPPGRVHAIPWKQVEGLAVSIIQKKFLGWRSKPQYALIIYAINQSAIRLDKRIPDLEELIASLKSQVYPILRPQIHQTYAAGKSLYFGNVKIFKGGLGYKGIDVLWRDITYASIQNGELQIHFPKGKPFRIPVKNILNIELFIELLEKEVQVSQ